MWDAELGEATPATYEGEEELEGTTVYKFVQIIEPTVIDTLEVPGSVFGSEEDSVEADMIYAMTRTLYIEPTTGAPVNRVEERIQELSYDGTGCPRSSAPSSTPRAQGDSVDEVQTKATLLRLAESCSRSVPSCSASCASPVACSCVAARVSSRGTARTTKHLVSA